MPLTINIHPINSYAAAAAHFNSTPPVRQCYDKETYGVSLRPAKRSNTSLMLRKRGPSYECVLFGTPVLTYHADESVVINLTDASTTTDAFVNRLLGWKAGAQYDKARAKQWAVTSPLNDKIINTHTGWTGRGPRVWVQCHVLADPSGRTYMQRDRKIGVRFVRTPEGNYSVDIETIVM